MTFGEKLTYYRKAKGFTQDDVAEKLGVTPQAVSKWENDATCPDIMSLPILSDLYGVSVDDLLREDRDTETPIVQYIPEVKRKSVDEMVLRILVDSGGDHVKVNIPIPLVKVILETQTSPASLMQVNGADLSKIDIDAIMKLVENGVIGKLVEVEGKNGETVVVEVV